MKIRTAAKIAGALFLIAMVSSLAGGSIINTLFDSTDYLSKLTADKNRLIVGVILEMVNALSVLGIMIMLSPVMRRYSEWLAGGYVSFRIAEALFCVFAAIIPLLQVVLSSEYLKAAAEETSHYQIIGNLLTASRSGFINLLVPVFFCLGALFLYSALYIYKLLPRFIGVWGFISSLLVFIVNLLQIDFTIELILALPMIINEIFLGIWLVVKGLNNPAEHIKAIS
jgi:hypothetical protein